MMRAAAALSGDAIASVTCGHGVGDMVTADVLCRAREEMPAGEAVELIRDVLAPAVTHEDTRVRTWAVNTLAQLCLSSPFDEDPDVNLAPILELLDTAVAAGS